MKVKKYTSSLLLIMLCTIALIGVFQILKPIDGHASLVECPEGELHCYCYTCPYHHPFCLESEYDECVNCSNRQGTSIILICLTDY